MLALCPLALLVLVCCTRSASAGTCAFRQECFQVGTDTGCTPTLFNEGEDRSSFPMDEAHGFGVAHDEIWDGTLVGSNGLCSNGGVAKEDGRCYTPWQTPKGLEAIAPIICPEYAEDSCCTWESNYGLYENLGTLVQSFGASTGCLACAVNLVRYWCGIACSPMQGSFIDIHDPAYVVREDDLTGGQNTVLQADIRVAADYACAIFESCRGTAIVGETTAMASGFGLLNFQMQTGAVGHGEYFFIHFTDRENDTTHDDNYSNGHHSDPLTHTLSSAGNGGMMPDKHNGPRSSNNTFDREADILHCDDFWDPGASTIPFPYPPPQEKKTSCGCDHCPASCASSEKLIDIVISDDPIPVLGGFKWVWVGGVYGAVVAASLVLPRLRGRRR